MPTGIERSLILDRVAESIRLSVRRLESSSARANWSCSQVTPQSQSQSHPAGPQRDRLFKITVVRLEIPDNVHRSLVVFSRLNLTLSLYRSTAVLV